jgi:hypothetical protein
MAGNRPLPGAALGGGALPHEGSVDNFVVAVKVRKGRHVGVTAVP